MGSKETPYYKVFKARNIRDGKSYQEQINTLSQRNFRRYLAESPNTVNLTRNDFLFQGVILSSKQDEFRLTKEILTDITFPLLVGDLITWENEFWLVFKVEQNPIKDYNKSYICKCNHLLKWIDRDGIRREQWVYEFSSKETMIRATFKSRVQHVLASEMNKFMEVIMPYTDKILREQRFIIDGEAWYVIELDSSSAKGITYITLGEDKKDLYNDSLISEGDSEDLADITKLNKKRVELLLPSDNIIELPVGSIYTIQPVAVKEGKISTGATFDFYVKQELKAENVTFFTLTLDEGLTEVQVVLHGEPEIKSSVKFSTVSTPSPSPSTTDQFLLIGDDVIKWGKNADYFMVHRANGQTIDEAESVTFEIDKPELATFKILDKDSCLVTANSKRLSGTVTLTATRNGVTREKQIAIVSLW